jgi:hypothetical protein
MLGVVGQSLRPYFAPYSILSGAHHVGILRKRAAALGPASRMALKIGAEVSPRNGKVPVAISYSTAPKENKSVRASSSLPFACSGDI